MELHDPHLFILLAPELAGHSVTQFKGLLTLLSSCFQPSGWEGHMERGGGASGTLSQKRLLRNSTFFQGTTDVSAGTGTS